MTAAIEKIMQAMTEDILNLSQIILNDDGVGINPKTGKNTLKNSHLKKDIEVVIEATDESVVISALFDNYVEYLERGRSPMRGKQPPIDALRDWAMARGIQTDNSTLFLIGRAIKRDGQQPRPILATLEEEMQKLFEDKWADQLMEAITEELNKYFE